MLTFQIIISFIIGGLFISLQTLFAERVPLKWRGIMLSIPSTMALGLFFIGLTKSAADVPQAAKMMPATMAASYLFVLAFAYFSQKNLFSGFFASFAVWATCAVLLLKFPPANLITSVFLYGMPATLIAYWLISKLKQNTALIAVPLTKRIIFVRSIIGGTIIALTVILAKTLGNSWGGLFATFPAAFTSTFLIYYLAHGKQVIASVGKSTFFPGAIGFSLYAVLAAFAFPKFGIWIGVLVPYIIIIPFYYFYTQLRTK